MQQSDTQQQMFNMLAHWQQSGISQKAYCEQHAIRYHVFHYWYKRFKSKVGDEKPDGTFIPVQISTALPVLKIDGIELLLNDGRRLLFNQPVSADFIKAIIG